MACIVEFNRNYRFNFVRNKYKQKFWIEGLLRLSDMDLHQISVMLNLPSDMLLQVHRGEHYFSTDQAELLGQLFLLVLSD